MNNTESASRTSFLSYWLEDGLQSQIRIIGNLTIFLIHFFSLPVLLKTLFSPWKRTYRKKQSPGISVNELFDVFTFNLISRLLGASIRLTTIIAGMIILLLFLLGSCVYLLTWFIMPIAPLIGYITKRTINELSTIKPSDSDMDIWKAFLQSPFGMFLIERTGIQELPSLSSHTRTLECSGSSFPHAFSQWFTTKKEIQELFSKVHINEHDIVFLRNWWERLNKKHSVFSREYLLRIPSIGKRWTYGYTPTIDQFTADLSKATIQYHANGRIQEMKKLEEILLKRHKANAFLLGEAGVGKHPLLIYLAHEIEAGRVFPQLEGKRMLSLEMERVFESHVTLDERKAVVSQILDEARHAGNIILVIEHFDRYVSRGKDREDLSDVFIHALAKGNISIIAAMTPGDFEANIRPNEELMSYFEILRVLPASPEQTLQILSEIIQVFENNRYIFTLQSLKELVNLADRFIPERYFPEKAITTMEHVEAWLQTQIDKKNTNRIQVTAEIIQHAFEEQEGIPIHINRQEAETLLHLEDLLHKRIVGQDKAINAIASALRRARTRITTQTKRPLGTFLFLGPTGVGKTETAKALADIFFGGENKLIRIDMNEYATAQSVYDILGEPITGNTGVLLPKIREIKYGVLLLDEFEKAHPLVKQLFLSIFDEGYITDGFGKTASFLNMIIIATSNAGAEYIREHLQEDQSILEQRLLEYLQQNDIFTPELLNRFDGIIVFSPLSHEQMQQILLMELQRLQEKVKETYGILLEVTPETYQKLLQSAFHKDYGGRSLHRSIQVFIENQLAEKVLKGELKEGRIIRI